MKKLSVIAFFTWMLAGCSKENNFSEEKVAPQPATVQYMGEPAADRLGWVLKMSNNSIEIPTNLPRDFQRDNLLVSVTFRRSGQTFPCRCLELKRMVDIISIEKIELRGNN